MTYQLPPGVEALIQEHMARGGYRSEVELLCDAFQALDHERQMIVYDDPEVEAGIARGLGEMEQDLGRPFEEFDAEFRAKTDASKSDG